MIMYAADSRWSLHCAGTTGSQIRSSLEVGWDFNSLVRWQSKRVRVAADDRLGQGGLRMGFGAKPSRMYHTSEWRGALATGCAVASCRLMCP